MEPQVAGQGQQRRLPESARRALAILIPCIAVLLVAGAVGAVTVEDDTSTVVSESPDRRAQTVGGSGAESAGLQAKLLSVADLPTGYTLQASNSNASGDTPGAGDSSTFCKELQKVENPDKAPEHADVTFEKGGASLFGGAVAAEGVARYPRESDARRVFDAFVAAMRSCKTFEETDQDGTFKGKFTPLSFPKLGDGTFAVHLAGEGGNQQLTLPIVIDFVLVRRDRVIMLVATFSIGAGGISSSDLEHIVRAGYKKLGK